MKIKNRNEQDSLVLLCAFIGLFEDHLTEDQKIVLTNLRHRKNKKRFSLNDQNAISILAAAVLVSICNENPQLVVIEQ